MNKTRYRIIFNSSRGCLMAVAETAAAQGKGAAGASRSAAAPLSGKATYSALTAVNCACKLFMGLITVCLPMFIIAPLGVQAQSVATRIVADPTAPTGQRPTVLTTANGVVQVDIRTPSAAGVSRNTYSQFDVGAAGAVLNNSRTAVQTQQGGWVQGNPWLATGTARVILNEVNSTDPSYLQGYVEVAGQRAQVIIANPSGIAVNGGGFINASGVTLTTGTPILNAGALDSFRVQGGQISVEGLGMDTRSADYTAILSRAVQVNAGIWAQQLQVVTGANDILATSVGADTQIQSAPVTSTAAVPVYALDVATLGGMYAGKIQLIGTEAGVGVRNAGLLQASSGPLTLNHQGWLSNSGSMQATGGDVQIQTQERIDQSGTIYSDKNVQLISNANQNHSGSTAALGDVHIRAMGLNADGTEANIQATKNSVWAAGLQTEGQITGQQTLMVQASGQVQTAGQALASQTLSMQASSLDVAQSRQQASTVTLQATSSDLQATGSRILVGQSLHLEAAKTLTTDQAQVQAQTLTLQANALSNKAGQITQTGSTEQSIRLQSTLDNTAGVIYSAAQTLNISAHSIDNTAGQILHAGQGTLAIVSQNQLTNHLQNSTQAAVADGARIIGAGEVQIQAQDLTNSGSIYAAQDVSTTAKSLNNSGSLYAGGAQTLSVTEAVQTSGTIAAAKNLTIQAQSLSATSTSVLAAGMAADGQLSGTGTLTAVTTGALQSAGQVLATQNLSLVGSSLDLSGSQTGTTSGDLRLTAHSGDIHTRQAQVSTPGKLSIAANSQSTQKLDNTEGTISAQQLDMQVAQLDNTDGLIWATDSLNISSDKLHNAQTATSSTPKGIQSQSGQLTLSAQALSNSGNIYAGQDLIANVTSLSNSGTLYASGSQSLSVTSDLSNSGTIAAAQDLKIQADNTSGTTTSVLAAGMTADGQLKGTGALTVSTTGSLQSAGQVLAAGALHMQGASLDLSQSTTGSTTGDVTLTASRGDILTRQAQISSPGLLKLSANAQATQKLDNTSGQISAKALDIQVGQLSNSQGQIQQTGTGVQTARIQSAAGITNTSGAILANAQDLTLSAAGALDNSEGQIGHAGTGQLNLTAASLNNTRGQVLGNGAQTWTVTGDANNTKGLVAAQSLDVTATGWNNTQGKLLSTQAGLSLRTSQNGITNTSGLIQSAQDLSLTGTGTNNKLQNSQGKIYAARDASVSTGNLNNDTALMAAGRNLSIDTHDQSLSNVGSRPASDSGANTAPAGLIAGGRWTSPAVRWTTAVD